MNCIGFNCRTYLVQNDQVLISIEGHTLFKMIKYCYQLKDIPCSKWSSIDINWRTYLVQNNQVLILIEGLILISIEGRTLFKVFDLWSACPTWSILELEKDLRRRCFRREEPRDQPRESPPWKKWNYFHFYYCLSMGLTLINVDL